eukprot:gnl/TRDRNA2_/TRDRNA2_173831_c0_seq2.p1 gnl/TRDRNA2_/TRDRNA2_173831_c0~~gnl/TRDRNA2_/TRDRNA2_173831_c0_seq2.p1  ORF type:complete len:465 (-),score=105.12 gnl/TRDRNA2_/TRDRNA2_173831_c0_seq2:139-1533(-)
MGNCIAGICGGSEPPPSYGGISVAGYGDVAPAANGNSAPQPASNAEAKPAEPVDDVMAKFRRRPSKDAQPEEKKEVAPAAPPKPARTDPIKLETLQGDWVNSVGAKINVEGTEVMLNGIKMVMHPVIVDEDGLVVSIGKIWQLNGWLEDDRIEWKECPSREVMQFARSVIWTQATGERMKKWDEQMKNLGYAGSSAAPLDRGIEGCMPGSCDAKARIVTSDANKDKEELELLNKIISEWREPGMQIVPPRKVIPDFSNRAHTGLSVEHVHYLACSFRDKGFQKRVGDRGHDIPVVVRQPKDSDLGQKSIKNWREKLKEEDGFPPPEHYERLFKEDLLFTSLGNGHFNQALNLFLNECKSIYGDQPYRIGKDQALGEAVQQGVSSIVLRGDIPLRERETVSRLLNSKREYHWKVSPDGSVDISDANEDTKQCKQFEALSKVLDAVELNCLVRCELDIKDSKRIGN